MFSLSIEEIDKFNNNESANVKESKESVREYPYIENDQYFYNSNIIIPVSDIVRNKVYNYYYTKNFGTVSSSNKIYKELDAIYEKYELYKVHMYSEPNVSFKNGKFVPIYDHSRNYLNFHNQDRIEIIADLFKDYVVFAVRNNFKCDILNTWNDDAIIGHMKYLVIIYKSSYQRIKGKSIDELSEFYKIFKMHIDLKKDFFQMVDECKDYSELQSIINYSNLFGISEALVNEYTFKKKKQFAIEKIEKIKKYMEECDNNNKNFNSVLHYIFKIEI